MLEPNPYESPRSDDANELSIADDISSNAAAEHLDQGEHLIWSGRPFPGIVLRPIDVVLIPFSIAACIFFIAWSYFAIRHFPLPLKFTAVLAIGFGFYLVYGRFLLDMRRRRKTIYVITDKRCLWIDGSNQSVMKVLVHRSDREINLVGAGSKGTIVFGQRNGLSHMYALAMGAFKMDNVVDEFEMIEDAKHVHETIQAIAARIGRASEESGDISPTEERAVR